MTIHAQRRLNRRSLLTRLLAATACLTLCAGVAAQGVLYDNGPYVTSPGDGPDGTDLSVLQSSLGMNTYGLGFAVSTGFRLADEFEVTTASGWQLEAFEVFAYQTGSGTDSSMNAVNFRIWDGPPGEEGSSVVYGDGTSDRLLDTSFTGTYRVLQTTTSDTSRPVMLIEGDAGDVYLPPGTYWFDVQAGGDLGSGPWMVPITVLGESVTGNAVQYAASTESWSPARDTATSAEQGIPFVLRGWDAELDLIQSAIPVPNAKPGDTNVPVLAFDAETLVAPGLDLTSLTVATVRPNGTAPFENGPAANVKLFLDADFDGQPDTPGSPLVMSVVEEDGTATLDVSGATIEAGVPVGFVVTYDLKNSLTSAAVPVAAAALALLLPGWWLARRGRKLAALVAFGLVVSLVSSCSTPPDPIEISFRARITSATSVVADGPFAGSSVSVNSAGMVGGTLTVVY